MDNNELLNAMQTMLKSELSPIKEQLNNIEKRLEILEIKQEVTQNKIDNLTVRVATIEHNQNKEFKKLNDEVDTLIEVMEAKGVLPKVE